MLPVRAELTGRNGTSKLVSPLRSGKSLENVDNPQPAAYRLIARLETPSSASWNTKLAENCFFANISHPVRWISPAETGNDVGSWTKILFAFIGSRLSSYLSNPFAASFFSSCALVCFNSTDKFRRDIKPLHCTSEASLQSLCHHQPPQNNGLVTVLAPVGSWSSIR